MEETHFFSSPVTSCFKGKGSVCISATEIRVYTLVFLNAMTHYELNSRYTHKFLQHL